MSINLKNQFTIAIMGESGVGKSALLLKYILNKYPKDHIPTIEDIFQKRTTIDDEPVEIEILDTAGDYNY